MIGLVVFLIALAFGGLGIVLAGEGHGERGFFLGLLLGPIGLIIVAILRAQPLEAAHAPSRRPCPYCAEPILEAARVCKHCGRDVPPAAPRELGIRPQKN